MCTCRATIIGGCTCYIQVPDGWPPYIALHALGMPMQLECCMKPLGRTPAQPDLSKVTLLSRQQVCKLLGIGAWTLGRWVQQGAFPRPVKLSDSTHRWALIDVEIWLQRRRRAPQARPRLRGKAAMWGQPKHKRPRVRL